jgi:hypothetical protein
LDRRRPREATAQQRCALKPGPGAEDFADLRVGRALLDEHVVPVVPPSHQTQVVHWCEHGRTRPNDTSHVTSQHLQPRRIACLRALPGGKADVLPVPQQRLHGSVDPFDIAVVGNNDQGSAAGRQ